MADRIELASEAVAKASENVDDAEDKVKQSDKQVIYWDERVKIWDARVEENFENPAQRDKATAERDKATVERDKATAERDKATAERDKADERLDKANELLDKARDYHSSGIESQTQKLLNTLEWREPKLFCTSDGHVWEYQGKSELADTIKDPLVEHYDAWQDGRQDKQSHALFLVLSGPGTGKSRMLDEMQNLLCAAAEQSKKKDLMQRMKNAYVFHVTFENGTSVTGPLINSKTPELDIIYRMVYQLSKERPGKDWKEFSQELDTSYSNLPLSIGKVIKMLADLKNINVKNMSVILCVDGLQKLFNDGTTTCDFYRVLTEVCRFLNSSEAFAVCVCSATVRMPVHQALHDSPQQRVFLLPPTLNGDKILKQRTRIGKQLVEDMGGHGRALEALETVLHNYKESLEEMDPTYVFENVRLALQARCGDIFDPTFSATTCREVLVAVLSRRSYDFFDPIGQANLTVDQLCSFGLFRQTPDGQLNCAFILLVMLAQKILTKLSDTDNFYGHLSGSILVWQRFEQFVALYRRVKSIAYREIPVALSTFHTGARFGPIKDLVIKELHSRRVVEAVSRQHTKSDLKDLTCFTNRIGNVTLSEKDTIVINAHGASAGDIFMQIQLTNGDQEVECNEVIQCKFLQSKKTITAEMYEEERAKSVNEKSDVFLLITSAPVNEFALPARCGIVSLTEFAAYFGPFASRAYQSVLEPPNINTASYQELKHIKGVGDATAEKIVNERKIRRFLDYDDAVKRVASDIMIADSLRGLHYDDEE